MKKYIVTIEETINQDFEIEANSKEEARRIAEDKYRDSEIVVNDGSLTYKQMYVLENNESFKNEEWIAF